VTVEVDVRVSVKIQLGVRVIVPVGLKDPPV
jgi:hypothetical protein